MAYELLGPLMALAIAAPAPAEKPPQIDQNAVQTNDVDWYLFDKYLATPKRDKHGEFASKDAKAAEFLGKTLKEFTIGCMDPSFKQLLYRAFKVLDDAGFNPGITAAFRDNYRQQMIIAGTRASRTGSYHGGSDHGGCGHGLAVDVVSLNGSTKAQQDAYSEKLWQWIDTHGAALGIGRPYGDKDAPHVAPITGAEYISHHKTRYAHVGKHKHHHMATHGKHHKHFAGHKNTARG